MKKEDIEKILDMSYPYLKEKAKDLSLVDIADIASKVWVDLQNEPKERFEDIVKYFIIDREHFEELEHDGSLLIDLDDDTKINLLYKPYAYELESGDIIGSESDPELIDDDEPELVNSYIKSEVEGTKFTLSDFGKNPINWIINHKSKIEQLLGFKFTNIAKDQDYADIVAEDSYGNKVLIYVDEEITSEKKLFFPPDLYCFKTVFFQQIFLCLHRKKTSFVIL